MLNPINDIQNIIDKYGENHGLSIALNEALKEARIYQSIIDHGPNDKTKIINKTKLHIGSGLCYLEGFINIDCFGDADLFCDLREGIPLKDGEYELIFSEHTLEHIDYPVGVTTFFQECFRLLQNGGKAIIGVPDTELVIQGYYHKDYELYKQFLATRYKNRELSNFQTYIDLVNFHMRDEIDSKKYTRHVRGYDYEKLEYLSKEFGFSSCKRIPFPSEYGNPKREFGSLYIELIK